MRKYHNLNKTCIPNYSTCDISYNSLVFYGTDNCGAVSHDVFAIWKQYVEEKKAKKMINLLMEHYDFPIYDSPPGLEREIN